MLDQRHLSRWWRLEAGWMTGRNRQRLMKMIRLTGCGLYLKTMDRPIRFQWNLTFHLQSQMACYVWDIKPHWAYPGTAGWVTADASSDFCDKPALALSWWTESSFSSISIATARLYSKSTVAVPIEPIKDHFISGGFDKVIDQFAWNCNCISFPTQKI